MLLTPSHARGQYFEHDLSRDRPFVDEKTEHCYLSYDDGGYRIRRTNVSGNCVSFKQQHAGSAVLETRFQLKPKGEAGRSAGLIFGSIPRRYWAAFVNADGVVALAAHVDGQWQTIANSSAQGLLSGNKGWNVLSVELRGVAVTIALNGVVVITEELQIEPGRDVALAGFGIGEVVFATLSARPGGVAAKKVHLFGGSPRDLGGGLFGLAHRFVGWAGQTYRLFSSEMVPDTYARIDNGVEGSLVAEGFADSTGIVLEGVLPRNGAYVVSFITPDSVTRVSSIALNSRNSVEMFSDWVDAVGDGYDLRSEWRDQLGSEYPAPDIANVTAEVLQNRLLITVQFVPSTFDPTRTQITVYLDTDQNEKTGYPNSLWPGSDHIVTAGATLARNVPQIWGRGTPTASTLSVIDDGYYLVIPLTELPDDGRLRFAVAASVFLGRNSDGTLGSSGAIDVTPGGRQEGEWWIIRD